MVGIPTIIITVSPEESKAARPPRAFNPVGFKIGNTLGGANQADLQRQVLRDALTVLSQPFVPGETVERHYEGYKPYEGEAETRPPGM